MESCTGSITLEEILRVYGQISAYLQGRYEESREDEERQAFLYKSLFYINTAFLGFIGDNFDTEVMTAEELIDLCAALRWPKGMQPNPDDLLATLFPNDAE